MEVDKSRELQPEHTAQDMFLVIKAKLYYRFPAPQLPVFCWCLLSFGGVSVLCLQQKGLNTTTQGSHLSFIRWILSLKTPQNSPSKVHLYWHHGALPSSHQFQSLCVPFAQGDHKTRSWELRPQDDNSLETWKREIFVSIGRQMRR